MEGVSSLRVTAPAFPPTSTNSVNDPSSLISAPSCGESASSHHLSSVGGHRPPPPPPPKITLQDNYVTINNDSNSHMHQYCGNSFVPGIVAGERVIGNHGTSSIWKNDAYGKRMMTSMAALATKKGHRLDPKEQICFDFTKGQCRRGGACKFSHDIDLIIKVNSQEKGICFDFLKGICARGALCRFSHDLHNLQGSEKVDGNNFGPSNSFSESNQTTSDDSKIKAPICYDFVKGQCMRGMECRYSHDFSSILIGYPPKRKNTDVFCVDYAKGSCKRGTNCRFSHMEASLVGSAVRNPANTYPDENIQMHSLNSKLVEIERNIRNSQHSLLNQISSSASNVAFPHQKENMRVQGHNHQVLNMLSRTKESAGIDGSLPENSTPDKKYRTVNNEQLIARRNASAPYTVDDRNIFKNNELSGQMNKQDYNDATSKSLECMARDNDGKFGIASNGFISSNSSNSIAPPMMTPDIATPPLGAIVGFDPSPASVVGSIQMPRRNAQEPLPLDSKRPLVERNRITLSKNPENQMCFTDGGGPEPRSNIGLKVPTMAATESYVSKLKSLSLNNQPLVPFTNPKFRQKSNDAPHGEKFQTVLPMSDLEFASNVFKTQESNPGKKERKDLEKNPSQFTTDSSPTIGASWEPPLPKVSSPFRPSIDSEAVNFSSKTPLRVATESRERLNGSYYYPDSWGANTMKTASTNGSVSLPALPSLGLHIHNSYWMDKNNFRDNENAPLTKNGQSCLQNAKAPGKAEPELNSLRSIWDSHSNE